MCLDTNARASSFSSELSGFALQGRRYVLRDMASNWEGGQCRHYDCHYDDDSYHHRHCVPNMQNPKPLKPKRQLISTSIDDICGDKCYISCLVVYQNGSVVTWGHAEFAADSSGSVEVTDTNKLKI